MQDESAECLFCHIAPGRVIAQNDLAYAIRDGCGSAWNIDPVRGVIGVQS